MGHRKKKGTRKMKKRGRKSGKRGETSGGSIVSTAGTDKSPMVGYFDKYTLKNPTYGMFKKYRTPFEKKIIQPWEFSSTAAGMRSNAPDAPAFPRAIKGMLKY